MQIPEITGAGMDLRDYQGRLKVGVFDAWRGGARDVCMVSGTGSGKSRTSASIGFEFANAKIPVVFGAHRQELVGQLSMALAAEGIYHNLLVSSAATRNWISNKHFSQFGRSYYHPDAPHLVASAQTLAKNKPHNADSFGLFVCDEGHHLLRKNTWGKCRDMFRNAFGLGPTATPDRGDGRGLGRHADGFYDLIVEGPPVRELIKRGYLCDYRVFCPLSDMDLSDIKVTAGGDYNHKQLAQASRKSHIVGDVVAHYLRIAKGKRGMTFVVSVEDAIDVAAAYNAAGVPAVALSADDSSADRTKALAAFERGEILQLVNVDLFGEGTDCPATEVISMARPTQSYSLYIQIFGRALRPSPGKDAAIIIDHVGNVERFIKLGRGLPDTPQRWTLDRRERGARSVPPEDVLSLTTCLECFAAYDSHLDACPWCGAVPEVGGGGRSAPERVDGDLYEMPADLLAKLRGEADRIVSESPDAVRDSMLRAGAPSAAAYGAAKAIAMRSDAQVKLRGLMGQWLNVWERSGIPTRDVQVMFNRVFSVDVLTAQTLGRGDAEDLAGRVAGALCELGQ